MSRPIGPNVKKLICHKMALIMIPPSTPKGEGFATGLNALAKPDGIVNAAKEATVWVFEAIDAVKVAHGCKFPDDEAIAGEILRGIEERKCGR